MEPWYRVATLRREVREGRSFNPDEFAIALEQVVAGTAPEDYRQPDQFFARTCFTRALRQHAGMVLRRLSGRTDNTAPVLTLITQFGGGKTHTLTVLYQLAKHGEAVAGDKGVSDLVRDAGLSVVPRAKVAVFVGNAWDPQPGRETPWIDVARQLAGDAGVAALGSAAMTTPPGTERPASSSSAASRAAIRSIPPRSRSCSASGRPCRSTSRRGARSRCWPSGFQSPRRTRSRRRGRSL
jgi:hypothetical protein